MYKSRLKRIGCIFVLSAASCAIMAVSLSVWAGEATFSKEDLLVLAEQQQSLIQDIQATVDYDCVKIEGNAEGIWRRNRFTFKIKGAKQYILSEGAHDLEAEEFESREERAYDGKISTLLFTGGDLANIREGKAGDIIGGYYPILSMAMMQGVVKGEGRYEAYTDLPTLLRVKWTRLRKETERIDGRDCHVVDLVHDGKCRFSVWLDVERGCMPLLHRAYQMDGSVKREFKTDKLWDFGDGLWLPVAGKCVLVFPDNRSEYVINALDAVTGKPRVKVNSGIKDEEFRVKIPPGTEVIDTYAGIAYSQPAIKPEEFIEPITEKPQKTEAPLQEKPPSRPSKEQAPLPISVVVEPQTPGVSPWVWVIPISLSVIGLGLVLLLKSRARSAHRGS